MHDFVAYESKPTHPLGARDSWPLTGPIYGIADRDIKPEPPKTIWQRLTANASEAPRETADLPGNLPIWY